MFATSCLQAPRVFSVKVITLFSPILGRKTSWFTEAQLIRKDSALGMTIHTCSASSGETEAENPGSKMKV